MPSADTVEIALIAAGASVAGGLVGAFGPLLLADKTAKAARKAARQDRDRAAREKRSDALVDAASVCISTVTAAVVAANDVVTAGPWQIVQEDGSFHIDFERTDVPHFRDVYQAATVAIEGLRLRSGDVMVKDAAAALRTQMGSLVDLVDAVAEQGAVQVEEVNSAVRDSLRATMEAAHAESVALLTDPAE